MNTPEGADSQFRRMLSALERSRLKLEAIERERSEPIAIVGAACRLPGGVVDLESFWTLLMRGGDAVSELPEARWNTSNLVDISRAAAGKTYCKAMAQLEGADRFDPAAFGISVREAERMDPQQRQLLEMSFEAMAHAGLNIDDLQGTDTGVFVGITANDFGHRFSIETADIYTATGNALSTASGRISYTFGFQGPAISVDTACSSSLTALHLACQSIRNKETSLALVGGVHVTAGPESSIGVAKLNALSPSGRCRTFSADADGYVRGEGCVVVVLRRLSDAVRAGDAILAVIRGTAVNQDGRSNGLTAPNRLAQTALLRSCLSQAKLQPADVGYLEAHGTGTELGDPIELAAAAAAYGIERDSPLWVGSAKTNIGHLEAAAGLAGLLRALLALRHATIPPNLHLNGLNPHFSWTTEFLQVPRRATPFKINSFGRRIAGVSSFSFSGTNAHVLLEQAPAPTSVTASGCSTDELLILSADSVPALQEQATRFARRLSEAPDDWREVCYTARFRRNARAERLALIGGSAAELMMRLGEFAQGISSSHTIVAQRLPSKPNVVAVFSGQGTQWAGMGRELYSTCSFFAQAFDSCAEAILLYSSNSMHDALAANESQAAHFDASITQPLIFAVSFALAEHMRSLGLRFSAVVGQSMGEVIAAAVAGVLTIDAAAHLICVRSRLGVSVRGGTMAMLSLSLADTEALIRGEWSSLTIAASNGLESTLVSGEAAAIAEFLATLEERGVFCRRLRVDYASHSPFMDPLLQPLKASLTELVPQQGHIPLYSTVTGDRINGLALTADYWSANLRQPVLFYPAVEQLIDDGFRLFLEIGPRPALSVSIDDALRRAGVRGAVACAMRHEEPQVQTALLAVAHLYAHGAELQVERVPARVVEIPAHRWRHTEFELPIYRHALVMNEQTDAIFDVPHMISGQVGNWIAEAKLSSTHPLVSRHRTKSTSIIPSSVIMDMALRVGCQLRPTHHVAVAEIKFDQVLMFRLDEVHARVLRLALSEKSPRFIDWRLSSCEDKPDATWTEHAYGRLRQDELKDDGTSDPSADLQSDVRRSDGAAQRNVTTLRMRIKGFSPTAQHEQICSLLRREAAAVLRVSASELTSDATFIQAGLDSLTGLELRNRIEAAVGFPLSSAIVWHYPTIDSFARFLLKQMVVQDVSNSANPAGASSCETLLLEQRGESVPMNDVHNRWFLGLHKVEQPRQRIFCIPYLGGLASVFSSWAPHLPDDIELLALQLPGRAPRHSEAAVSDYLALVDALRAAFLPKLDVPYVIYGHSLGALLSFGLVHALRDADAQLPKHLFLAAYPAPHLHNPVGDMARLPEPDLIEGLKKLQGIPEQIWADAELLNLFLPSLRADVELLGSYAHVPQTPLTVPVTILSGREDHIVERAEISEWRNHFSGIVDFVEIDGGHYFVKDTGRDVVRSILSRMT